MKALLQHPDDNQLVALALSDATTDFEVETHVGQCVRCQRRIQDVLSLREELVTAPRPRVYTSDVAPILARRAAGERVALTDERPTRTSAPPAGRWSAVVTSVAAVVALMLVWRAWPTADRTATAVASTRAAAVADSVASGLPRPSFDASAMVEMFAPWPAMAYAATLPDTERALPALSTTGGTLLLTGVRRYVRSSASSYHEAMPIGAVTVDFADTNFAGERVWRLVTDHPLESGGSVDSAWIRQRDFTLLRRTSHSFGNALTQRIVGDTLLQQTYVIDVPTQLRDKFDPRMITTNYPLRLSARPMITDASMFMLLLRTQPLHAGWRGSVDVNANRTLVGAPASPRSVNITVDGDSLVSTLWGHVACWRVVVHSGRIPERWYVSKEGREVILMTGPNGMEWPRSRLDLMGRYLK